ncbi:hypothetical protein SLA2020_085670 [Shorea laevis]
MAVTSNSASQNVVSSHETKRTKCPGVRLVGGRIYDSENGKTCHQCRQKTRDFSASCKNLKRDKQCTIKYCHKCLLNRYGEKAEEVELLDDWKCPKCRGNCNCSFCMKKRGHKPTGMLVQKAKATGFSSVSEMLQVKGPGNLHGTTIKYTISPKKQAPLTKEYVVSSSVKPGKENFLNADCDSEVNSQNLAPNSKEKKSKKVKRKGLKELSNRKKDYGTSLRESSPKRAKTSIETSKNEVKGNSKAVVRHGDSLRCSSTEESKGEKGKKAGVSNVTKNSEGFSTKGEPAICDAHLENTNLNPGVSNGVENDNAGAKVKAAVEFSKVKKCDMDLEEKYLVDIQLPQGTSLVTVAGIDLLPKDVGHVLQFLEFCAAFGEVLLIRKGQAESVIREIIRGRSRRQLPYSSIGQIHIQLLSLIQKDMGTKFPSLSTGGKDSWFQALGQCVSESQCSLEEFPSNIFDKGVDAYNMLDSSKKLKLLNFLCDEALSTRTLRSWMEDQNSKFGDRKKEAKEKVLLAKDREKQLKKKMQDKLAEAIIAKNGASLSISEHDAIVAKIKREVAQAHREMLEAEGMLPKKRERADAVRTEPILLGVNGHAFWKLRGYTGELDILLQDLGTWDAVVTDDKWFGYGVVQKQEVERYISTLRTKRLRIQKVLDKLPFASPETSS